MVLNLAGAVAQRNLLHKPQAASGTHRCLRQRLQRQGRALRLDQEKGPSTPLQRPPYHSALIPGTRLGRYGATLELEDHTPMVKHEHWQLDGSAPKLTGVIPCRP